MNALITAVLALIPDVVGLVPATGTVGKIITILSAIMPPAIQLARDEIPVVKGIITTLRGTSAVTPEQLDELDKLDAICDAAFDAALAAAEAEDAAASKED